MNLHKLTRSLAIGLLFLVPIFPLIVANSFFFPFITGKAFYFRLLIELAFASWIILAFLDARYRPKFNAMTVGVTVFAVVTLVADLLGYNPVRSIWSNFERMEGWLTIVHLWAFYMVAVSVFGSGAEGKRHWHRWFNFSLIIAAIVGLYGLFQLFGWLAIHQGSTRIDATLGNAAYMAVYMLIHTFLAAYFFFAARTRAIKASYFLTWTYAIGAVFFAFLLFETATRGTILGLIGGILVAAACYALFARRAAPRGRWIAAGTIVAVILIGVIFWMNRGAAFIQKSETLSRMASISWSENKTQARGYIWPMALEGWKERPVFGWGQENFNYIFNKDYNPKMWNQEQWFDRAHSVYLDWLVAGGAVGLLSYLALYVLFLIAIWKSGLGAAEKSVLTGLLAAYAVHNIFVFDNLASYALFFALLGFASFERGGKPIAWLGSKPLRTDAVEYIVAPIVIVLVAASVYFVNVRPVQANTRLIAALRACGEGKPDIQPFQSALGLHVPLANQEIREQLLACTSAVVRNPYPAATQQEFYALASDQIDAQIAATPSDARIYTLGGSFFLQSGDFGKALPLLEKAHELSPAKQSINLPLATAYINAGKGEEMVALLKQTYESAPENSEARLAYAIGLIVNGSEAEAHTIFGNDPDIFENPRLVQAYLSIKQYPKAIALYQTLIARNPQDLQMRVGLAEAQYAAGQKTQAIQTLRAISKEHPEYTDQIEAAIKQVQAR